MTAFILGGIGTVAGSASSPVSELEGYGRNLGNLAFQTAIYRHIGGGRHIPRDADVSAIAEMGSLAVIPAANHLSSHNNLGGFARKIETAGLRCIMLGLGAQNDSEESIPDISSGTLQLISAIAKQSPTSAPNIGVRGYYSQSVLAHYGLDGMSVVLGCPSHFLCPKPYLGRSIQFSLPAEPRIAVAAGVTSRPSVARIEPGLANLVEKTRGSYVIQAPKMMMRIAGCDYSRGNLQRFTALRDFVRPELSVEDFLRWMNIYARYFLNVDSWMTHYRQHDLVIGTRLHGVLLALQAGVPAVCLTHDTRTKELCELLHLPHCNVDKIPKQLSPRDAFDLFQFDAEAFDETRRQLALSYTRFLRANTIQPVSWLSKLAKEDL